MLHIIDANCRTIRNCDAVPIHPPDMDLIEFLISQTANNKCNQIYRSYGNRVGEYVPSLEFSAVLQSSDCLVRKYGFAAFEMDMMRANVYIFYGPHTNRIYSHISDQFFRVKNVCALSSETWSVGPRMCVYVWWMSFTARISERMRRQELLTIGPLNHFFFAFRQHAELVRMRMSKEWWNGPILYGILMFRALTIVSETVAMLHIH